MRLINYFSILFIAAFILTLEAVLQQDRNGGPKFPEQELQEIERYAGEDSSKGDEDNELERIDGPKNRPKINYVEKREENNLQRVGNNQHHESHSPRKHSKQLDNRPASYLTQKVRRLNHVKRAESQHRQINDQQPRLKLFEPIRDTRPANHPRDKRQQEGRIRNLNRPQERPNSQFEYQELKPKTKRHGRQLPRARTDMHRQDDALEFMIGQKKEWLKKQEMREEHKQRREHVDSPKQNALQEQLGKKIKAHIKSMKSTKNNMKKDVYGASLAVKQNKDDRFDPKKGSKNWQKPGSDHMMQPRKNVQKQHNRQSSSFPMLVASSITVKAPQGDYEEDSAEKVETQKANVKPTSVLEKKPISAEIDAAAGVGESSNMGNKEVEAEYTRTKAFGMVTAPNSFPPICKPRKIHIFSQEKIKCACHFKCHFECSSPNNDEEKTAEVQKQSKEEHSLKRDNPKSAEKPAQVCRRVCTQKTCKRPLVHSVFDYKIKDGVCKKWRLCAFRATCEGKQHRWISYKPIGCKKLWGNSHEAHKLSSDLEDTATLHMVNKMHNKRGKNRIHGASIPSISFANLNEKFVGSSNDEMVASPHTTTPQVFSPYGFNYMGYMPAHLMPRNWHNAPLFYLPPPPFASMSYSMDAPDKQGFTLPSEITNWEDVKDK